jgi:hypothetical protein
MFGAHDQQLLLMLISHHYVMDDLYFADECFELVELEHLTHRIRVDS